MTHHFDEAINEQHRTRKFLKKKFRYEEFVDGLGTEHSESLKKILEYFLEDSFRLQNYKNKTSVEHLFNFFDNPLYLTRHDITPEDLSHIPVFLEQNHFDFDLSDFKVQTIYHPLADVIYMFALEISWDKSLFELEGVSS